MKNVGLPLSAGNTPLQHEGFKKGKNLQAGEIEKSNFSGFLLNTDLLSKNGKETLQTPIYPEKNNSGSPQLSLLSALTELDSYIGGNRPSNQPLLQVESADPVQSDAKTEETEEMHQLSSLLITNQEHASVLTEDREVKEGSEVKNAFGAIDLEEVIDSVTDHLHAAFPDLKVNRQAETLLPPEENVETMQVIKSVETLFEQVSIFLPSDNKEKLSTADSKAILNLLEQWQALEKQTGSQGRLEQLVNREMTGFDKMDKKLLTIWTKLTETYEKRLGMESSNKYQAQASVSTADITKWIAQALDRYQSSEVEEVKPVVNQSSAAVPMSKVEQFTVHIQQTGNSQTDDQKLQQEFQRVLNASKFIQSNGSTELLLKLKPANLGEVLVKMVEVNGEMLVKISVSSQAAKEALEGNMTQLRHMFSPSQVTIERQENNMLLQETYKPEADQGELTDQSAAEEETSEQSSGETEEETEAANFLDYLTAEKEQVS